MRDAGAPDLTASQDLCHRFKSGRGGGVRRAPQFHTTTPGQFNERVRVGEVGGDWFLTPDVSTGLQPLAIEGRMKLHGRKIDEQFEIYLGQHAVNIGKIALDGVGLGVPASELDAVIADRHKLYRGTLL